MIELKATALTSFVSGGRLVRVDESIKSVLSRAGKPISIGISASA